MKTLRKCRLGIVLFTIAVTYGITVKVPDFPKPKIALIDAIKQVQATLDHGNAELIVTVEWTRWDKFQARWSDGGQYHIADGKDEWCWYFTLVQPPTEINRFGGVSVGRVRDNGKLERLLSTST